MDPVVMVEQVRDFPRLNREYVRPFDQLVSDALTPLECLSLLRVVVTGDGDSYHAAHAAELAFECLGGVACEPLSAQRCRDYAVEWLPQPAPRTALVVGVSASGQTRRVVECLERARARHALTLALTGAPASPVAAAAECRLVVALPDPVPSPGLRTYHASLLGLLLLAIRLGEVRGRYHQDEANGLRRELAGLADVMAATIAAAAAPARAAAEALGD
ncbi:MAG TPA: SIS domain-containing protein, partial [Thermomicrobiales bacterium]|nr:SIS domain-containing protein [Thermomicrobiales bacterium]